jgi:uncharacterized membrane protein (DUF2068 family)
MKRSAGITISSVLVFVGSGLALLSCPLMGFSLTVAAPNGNLPHGFGAMVVFMIVGAAIFAAWGIASGVGLLNLREWARISALVFSALLLIISVPGALLFLFVNLPLPANSPNPEMAQHVLSITRFALAGFYAVMALLGAAWLYYFTREPVKKQFVPNGAMIALDRITSAAAPGAYSRGRPLSITIIAGFMGFGVFSLPMFLVLHLPIMFLGFFFVDSQALLIILGYCAIQAAIAYGLWEMKAWGRNLAIYYFNFAIFNAVISVILPGAQARYEEAMRVMQTAMGTPASPVPIPIWFTLIFVLPVIGIQLAFLIASRKAFESPRNFS